MKRTISAEVGKGSVNHNSRKYRAENVDGSRTNRNIVYCNERIQTVYHQLFDEALKRYNEKQTRSDRRIPNYYEKIRSGNQEKPFHEIILQIGNKDDMSATGEYAELTRTVLDEYYQGFQERNPNLRVFSAHLHMDEAAPHIHIDFVPFTTGSKRGLDTRVSLKQALAAQGFKGGTRGATEWAQWVQSEKEQLAAVMERYDIQWEQKGTHEKHLSVLDYKKQEREKEIAALDSTLAEKQDELETMRNRIDNFDQGVQSIEKLEQRIETDSEYQLPDPPTLMTAKTYKQRFVDPLIKKLKEIIREVFYRYYKALDSYHRLNTTNGRLYRENEHLNAANYRLKGENEVLRSELKDFRFLRKVFGSRQIDNLIAQAKDMEQQRKHTQRPRRRNTNFERWEQTMSKTIFEEMGGTYTQVRDYLLPDLKLPEEDQQPIGIWGRRHRRYLKEHRRATYATLFTNGKLSSYLADIDRQAEEMFSRLVKQMAEAEGVTETLKATDPMEWVGRMNNIRNRAMEIVNSELIYRV